MESKYYIVENDDKICFGDQCSLYPDHAFLYRTLAFAVPALTTMMEASKSLPKRRSPRMLVLAPTRELAMQSDAVLQEFGTVAGLRSIVLYGGVPKYTQVAELKKKDVDCLVATPGRLKDLVNEGSCDLSKVQHLVLDEAVRDNMFSVVPITMWKVHHLRFISFIGSYA